MQEVLRRFLPEDDKREDFAKLFQAASVLFKFAFFWVLPSQVYTSDGEKAEQLAGKFVAVEGSV